ncbi:hypothetical protein K1719_015651 [Acacia pycnantha]|nr:hypothetical protein K1719_015651 [Acacia pycnantha]
MRGAGGNKLVKQLNLACKRDHPCLVVISETKCLDDSRLRCLQSLGFDGLAFEPSVGRFGGIAAAWKLDQIEVVLCRQDRQFLHFNCSYGGYEPFYFTALYSIPGGIQKQLLWNALEDLSLSISIPWVILGDFNDIAAASEKIGGSGNSEARIRLFTERIRRCNLSDLGSCGPRFTWKGPRLVGNGRIFERLDRAFVNDKFLLSFADRSLQVKFRVIPRDANYVGEFEINFPFV